MFRFIKSPATNQKISNFWNCRKKNFFTCYQLLSVITVPYHPYYWHPSYQTNDRPNRSLQWDDDEQYTAALRGWFHGMLRIASEKIGFCTIKKILFQSIFDKLGKHKFGKLNFFWDFQKILYHSHQWVSPRKQFLSEIRLLDEVFFQFLDQFSIIIFELRQ